MRGERDKGPEMVPKETMTAALAVKDRQIYKLRRSELRLLAGGELCDHFLSHLLFTFAQF